MILKTALTTGLASLTILGSGLGAVIANADSTTSSSTAATTTATTKTATKTTAAKTTTAKKAATTAAAKKAAATNTPTTASKGGPKTGNGRGEGPNVDRSDMGKQQLAQVQSDEANGAPQQGGAQR
jgi:hypothetical protein